MEFTPNRSHKIILGSQYFLYFGIMGIFLPYFNLYCYHIGFNGFQIGLLSTLRSVTLVLFPLFWGTLSDKYRIRKPLYIMFNLASSFVWAFYFFTTNFWWMFAITFFYGVFYAPIISFLETFTMEVLGIQKNRYGKIRAWGSISFIGIVILLGKLIDMYTVEIILIFILVISLIQTAISPAIPGKAPSKKQHKKMNFKILFTGRIIIFLTCGFLMLLSHGTYYGFFSIHLENLGFSGTFIGMTWALASISEIMTMLKSDWIFKRFRIENILIISFVIASARWLFLYATSSPFVILLTQLLHAITYGTFHMASILYIDQLTPSEAKTTGQAINNATSYGLGLMIGFFINGSLYERMGANHLFLLSGFIALSGGILFLIYRIHSYKFLQQ